MNKFKKFIAMSSILIVSNVMAVPAFATSAPASGQYNGAATAFKGIVVDCSATVDLDWTTGKGRLDLHSGVNCGALLFVESKGKPDNHWYNISWDSVNHQVVFHNVYVETVTLGDCAATELRMDVDHTPDTLLIDSVLPPATGTLSCTVQGYAVG